jgi:hypothetical protein
MITSRVILNNSPNFNWLVCLALTVGPKIREVNTRFAILWGYPISGPFRFGGDYTAIAFLRKHHLLEADRVPDGVRFKKT